MTLTTAGAFGPRRELHQIGLVLGGVLFATGSVLAGDPGCTAGHFANPEFAAGEGACAVALGDLNADGAVDAVVANRYGALVPPGSSGNGTISVLLNNGDRTMAGQIVYPAGSYPWSLVLADLDGDGDLDLAISDQQNDNVLVLFNDGNAGFTPGATYPVGDFAAQIVSGDLDGDGDPDLAVTCRVPNAVSILRNNGNGTFAAAEIQIMHRTFLPGDEPANPTDTRLTRTLDVTGSELIVHGPGLFLYKAEVLASDVPKVVPRLGVHLIMSSADGGLEAVLRASIPDE